MKQTNVIGIPNPGKIDEEARNEMGPFVATNGIRSGCLPRNGAETGRTVEAQTGHRAHDYVPVLLVALSAGGVYYVNGGQTMSTGNAYTPCKLELTLALLIAFRVPGPFISARKKPGPTGINSASLGTK